MSQYKTCTKCKQVTSTDNFYRQSRSKDGFNSYCKPCFNVINNKARKTNPDAKNKATAKWRANNPERVKETKRAWRIKNKEKVNTKKRAWNAANKQIVYEMNQRSYKNNTALFIANSRSRRARQLNAEHNLVTKSEIEKLRNSNCVYCGSNEQIEIDHIQPLNRGGRHSIGNLVPACLKCNRSKKDLWLMEWRIREMKKGLPNISAE